VSRVLKEQSPNAKIMVCEPDNAPILASGVSQSRNNDGSHSESHPNFRPHLMQGWSPDFIPQLAETALECRHIDGYISIDGNFSLQCAKDLAQKEGIFVGISAGATLAGALKLAETAPEGSNILCMLPDTGERYLSTPLFDGVATEMTSDEQAISCSTPGYRFDLSTTTAPADEASELDEAAVKLVDEIIQDDHNPIVMYALEWCEFCWSVRKVLDEYGIPYRSIDIDSVEYQDDNLGAKMRVALRNKTTWNTFPQIFIQGEFYGGCTDLFDGCKNGSLLGQLKILKIPCNDSVETDPYSFLPGWLHPR